MTLDALLEKGAELEVQGQTTVGTPLSWAAENGNGAMVKAAT